LGRPVQAAELQQWAVRVLAVGPQERGWLRLLQGLREQEQVRVPEEQQVWQMALVGRQEQERARQQWAEPAE
jgi:hypothetical protein